MAGNINIRELIVGVLLEINKEGQYSHMVLRNTLNKYQYLEKKERAFLTRVCEGTQENLIRIDYIINYFSKVKVAKMKPLIRELLRSSVYQLVYMDHVPDSAVCNEAVKIARKKGFYNLTGFVNGVLRSVARDYKNVKFPDRSREKEYLSVTYSMPEWLVERFLEEFGSEKTEKMLAAFLEEQPVTVRIREFLTEKDQVIKHLKREGVTVEKAPYVENAYYLKDYDYLTALEAFRMGNIQVQDVSSMIAGEVAAPEKDSYVIDLCAAPGGKSICAADKMMGTGTVDARDVSEYKTDLIRENVERMGLDNIKVSVKDAREFDRESVEKADLLIADLPCSGLGVIGKKTDIKHKITSGRIEELAKLQREILEQAAAYVKPGGVLLYSTCTVTREENIDNVKWFTRNYPYELESIDEYIAEELRSVTTKKGYLQLLPGVHACDGFFMARLRRMK